MVNCSQRWFAMLNDGSFTMVQYRYDTIDHSYLPVMKRGWEIPEFSIRRLRRENQLAKSAKYFPAMLWVAYKPLDPTMRHSTTTIWGCSKNCRILDFFEERVTWSLTILKLRFNGGYKPHPGVSLIRESASAFEMKYIYIYIWLVVGPPLWKIWKSIGMIIPNIWENKKCSKPPIRYMKVS